MIDSSQNLEVTLGNVNAIKKLAHGLPRDHILDNIKAQQQRKQDKTMRNINIYLRCAGK